MHDANGLTNRPDLSEVIAADAEDRDLVGVAAKRSRGDGLHDATTGAKARPHE
jgi:hypothetical protein